MNTDPAKMAPAFRRVISCTLVSTAFLMLTGLLPVAAVGLPLVDLVRGKFKQPLARFYVFAWAYVGCEVLGIGAAAFLWAARTIKATTHEAYLEQNRALQRLWSTAVWKAGVVSFGLKLEVENPESVLDGKFAIFSRHVSLADSVLPAILIANPQRRPLRYVLKSELLWDPCLDIVGNRLPNVFLTRARQERDKNVRLIREISTEIPDDEAVLIFPEGTRYSPEKLQSALSRPMSDSLRETTRQLRGVLPIRFSGPQEILSSDPELDLVVMSHVGMEHGSRLKDMLAGGLIGRSIKVRFERYPAHEIPRDTEEQQQWLLSKWIDVDRWVQDNDMRFRRARHDSRQVNILLVR